MGKLNTEEYNIVPQTRMVIKKNKDIFTKFGDLNNKI